MEHNFTLADFSEESFFQRHKTKIAVATTAVVCLWINRLSHAQKDEFLKEHDLYELYYNYVETPEY